MIEKVAVSFGSGSTEANQDYEVLIGTGLVARLGEHLKRACPAHRYAIISDSRVAGLYGNQAYTAASSGGSGVDLFTFHAGEAYKTRESWAELSDRMLQAGLGRDAAVVALGGGVTGDLAGFVAATFLRGVPLVQVPTTILAMIDSSVGGKTGVDTVAGKNLIGSFHQPRLVLADTETLQTLEPAEVRSGIAEGVKHGAIADGAYFEETVRNADELLSLDTSALNPFIRRSVEIKAGVVAADEREGGVRKTLNFGHTIGHAVEALSRFSLLHGEAVAIGMVVEAKIGERLGVTAAGTARAIEQALVRFGLPTRVPEGFAPAEVLEYTRLDKKAREGKVEYSLLEGIGKASRGTGSYGIPVEDKVVVAALKSS